MDIRNDLGSSYLPPVEKAEPLVAQAIPVQEKQQDDEAPKGKQPENKEIEVDAAYGDLCKANMLFRIKSPPITLSDEYDEKIVWHEDASHPAAGRVDINGKTFSVAKTVEGKNIIGTPAGKDQFRATDTDGRFIGVYHKAENGKYFRVGLKGGGSDRLASGSRTSAEDAGGASSSGSRQPSPRGADAGPRGAAHGDPVPINQLPTTNTFGEITLNLDTASAEKLQFGDNCASITLSGTDGKKINATVLRTAGNQCLLGRLSSDKSTFMLMRADEARYGPVIDVAGHIPYKAVSNQAYRSDDYMTRRLGNDGKPKSHLNSNGDLIPANPNGKASISDHVRGNQTGRKSDSPYTSFSTANVEGVSFGSGELVTVNLERLEADLSAGVPTLDGVKIFKQKEVLAAIQEELASRIRGKKQAAQERETAAHIWATAKNGGSQFNARLADTVQKFQKAYENARNANEVLIRGVVPAQYIKHFS